MNKKQFEERFKLYRKQAKIIKVELKNGDIVYTNKYEPSKIVPHAIWLLLHGQKIFFTKYKHVKEVWF